MERGRSIMGIQWVAGEFIARPNRFVASVRIDGIEERAHVPNTGRLMELLVPGTPILLTVHDVPGRKYRFSLRQVQYQGNWVSIDSQLPNRLVRQAIDERLIFSEEEWIRIQPETKHGESRFDFALHMKDRIRWIEVKGVTLERNGWGYFPDAPTSRGTRHIKHLQSLVEAGDEAVVIFVIQNTKAQGITPNWDKDPAFAQAVQDACHAGVRFLAYSWAFEGEQQTFLGERPVRMKRTHNREGKDDKR